MAETLKYFMAVSSLLPGAHYVETRHVLPFHRTGNQVNLSWRAMLIICVFQRAEIVWACSGNPLRLVTSLSAFLLRGNGQRHTGYQETELTSEWWAADVSFPQVSARILHRSTSLSAADQTATQVMMLIVTTVRLQLFISLSLSTLRCQE